MHWRGSRSFGARPNEDVGHAPATTGAQIKPLTGETRDAFAVIGVFGFWSRRIRAERGSDLRQFFLTNGVGEKAEMADAPRHGTQVNRR